MPSVSALGQTASASLTDEIDVAPSIASSITEQTHPVAVREASAGSLTVGPRSVSPLAPPVDTTDSPLPGMFSGIEAEFEVITGLVAQHDSLVARLVEGTAFLSERRPVATAQILELKELQVKADRLLATSGPSTLPDSEPAAHEVVYLPAMPPEIFERILSFLDDRDLRNLRLTGSRLAYLTNREHFLRAARFLSTPEYGVEEPESERGFKVSGFVSHLARIEAGLSLAEVIPRSVKLPTRPWLDALPGESAGCTAAAFLRNELLERLVPEKFFDQGDTRFFQDVHAIPLSIALRHASSRLQHEPPADRVRPLMILITAAMHLEGQLDRSNPHRLEGEMGALIKMIEKLHVDLPDAAIWLRHYSCLGSMDLDERTKATSSWLEPVVTSQKQKQKLKLNQDFRLRVFDVPIFNPKPMPLPDAGNTAGIADFNTRIKRGAIRSKQFMMSIASANSFEAPVVKAFLESDPSRIRRFIEAGGVLRAENVEGDAKKLNLMLDVLAHVSPEHYMVSVESLCRPLMVANATPEDLQPIGRMVDLMSGDSGDGSHSALIDSMVHLIRIPVILSQRSASAFAGHCLRMMESKCELAVSKSLMADSTQDDWTIDGHVASNLGVLKHFLSQCADQNRAALGERLERVEQRVAEWERSSARSSVAAGED